MPKPAVFKGFNPEEIVDMYKFCVKTKVVSERVEKKRLDNQRLNELFPKSRNWEEVIDLRKLIHYPTLVKLMEANADPYEGFYFANTKGSILKSLIIFLRESFIDGNIKKEGDKIIIEKEKEDQSLFGTIPVEKFKSFINLFID